MPDERDGELVVHLRVEATVELEVLDGVYKYAADEEAVRRGRQRPK